MPSKRPTMKDVAKHAGVSTATVSLVVRGSSQIPPETCRRVEQSMKEIGYVYNRIAGNLRGGGNTTFGLVISSPRNPYFIELIIALEEHLADTDDMVISAFSICDCPREITLARKLAGQGISGLIIMPSTEYEADALDSLSRQLGIPIVMLIHHSAPTHDCVVIDDHAIGTLIADHLRDLGATRVAFIGGYNERSNYRARVASLTQGLGARLDAVLPNTSKEDELTAGTQLTDRLIATNGPDNLPDAIVCFNDNYAVGATASLRHIGKEPGKDIIVIGIDNSPISRILPVPLTTVDTHADKVGLEALDLLKRRLNHHEANHQVRTVTPSLVVRQSSSQWKAGDTIG